MKSRIKIWHFILLLWLLIVIFRFDRIIDAAGFLFLSAQLIFTAPGFVFDQLDFSMVDFIVSVKLIFLLPFILYIFRKKAAIIFRSSNLSSSVVILLLFGFIFSPVISNTHPDFYKNIGMTRLLPPLSTVLILHLKEVATHTEGATGNFLKLKESLIKKPFDEKIIFIDSLIVADEVVYYQKGLPVKMSLTGIEMKNSLPLITKRMFILGTDEFGRDIFTRLMYGTRTSLSIGFLAVLISLLAGLILGYLAGYAGGVIDLILSRLTDMFLAFPVIFFVVLILALFGNNFISIVLVLGFSTWMSLFKIVKAEVLSVKTKDFFQTAKLIGLSKTRLLLREVLPVIMVPVIVNIVFQYGNVILAESALSYLGLGIGNELPSWGSMIESGQEYIYKAWWMIFFPGLILTGTLLAANSIGRNISKYFNPRLD